MLSRALFLFFISCFFWNLVVWPPVALGQKPLVRVGAKRFTENYILAEIMSQYLESKGFEVKRRFGLGGSLIAFQALREAEIDIYPEYTGTLLQGIFRKKKLNDISLQQLLSEKGLEILFLFGFNNSYTLIMNGNEAKNLGISKISDLTRYPNLKGGLSGEFQGREDGWKELKKTYGLKNSIRSIEVPLTYQALKNHKVGFVEAYTTEPLVKKYQMIFLRDDKNFFPIYDAVALVRKNLSSDLKKFLSAFKDRIHLEQMTALNQRANEGVSFEQIAKDFLIHQGFVKKENLGGSPSRETFSYWNFMDFRALWRRIKTHLFLTVSAVLLACLVTLPVAAFVVHRPKLAQWVLSFVGLLQTIPSIALLTFMIPFAGIGYKPALMGLFIYSLLPILRNTYTALKGIDPKILISARGIGLYPWEIFFSIKLPLSLPMILAGVRTATILNIGTATLAAFIGAGGLGEPIVTGLALNDVGILLEGAIPAALLAVVVDFFFGLLHRFLVIKL